MVSSCIICVSWALFQLFELFSIRKGLFLKVYTAYIKHSTFLHKVLVQAFALNYLRVQKFFSNPFTSENMIENYFPHETYSQ